MEKLNLKQLPAELEANRTIRYSSNIRQTSYKGIETQQIPEALNLVYTLITNETIDFVFELGTADGGFTRFLNDLGIKSFHINDLNQSNWYDECTSEHKMLGDIFSSETEAKIKELVATCGKSLWMFDNGNKPAEFNKFSILAKPGDILMVHDFAPDLNSFKWLHRNNIWLWFESSEDVLNLTNIERHENFDQIWTSTVWGVYRKL